MNQSEAQLPDGEYKCAATVHFKSGRAVVVLHTTFGLAEGSRIELLRADHDVQVAGALDDRLGILNGHAII